MADEKLIFGLAEHHYQAMAELLGRHASIERVLIFGSRAKGTAKPWSDIDLAVVAPGMSDQEFSQLLQELEGLELVFKLDLLHFDRLIGQPKLRETIEKHGLDFLTIS
ncbi:MAG: nucleotidyltransferase domain-containing protein [Geobacter sp.]|nr:nucleotidyltransferase domain-containing protein [Geobacter sp.]